VAGEDESKDSRCAPPTMPIDANATTAVSTEPQKGQVINSANDWKQIAMNRFV
jgi:hypothetical protein